MENLFGLMKNELLYVNHFDSIEDFENELKKYIWWYNNKRIKLRLKGMSPAQYRAHYYKNGSSVKWIDISHELYKKAGIMYLCSDQTSRT